MVVLTRIYTRTGDDGTSALASGERRAKTDPRFEAIGAVDELNAAIGLARTASGLPDSVDAILGRVQNDLFDLGADFATTEARQGQEALRVSDGQVARLEAEIDGLNSELEPLTSFVLPGGTAAGAALHQCRVVARRAERQALRLHELEPLNLAALKYLNRLSDAFFVAARWANDRGRGDVLWQPGQNR